MDYALLIAHYDLWMLFDITYMHICTYPSHAVSYIFNIYHIGIYVTCHIYCVHAVVVTNMGLS